MPKLRTAPAASAPDRPAPERDRAQPSGEPHHLIPAPYGAAAVVITLAVLMGATFALSYGLALARPRPREVPVAVVGSTTAPVVEQLQARAAGGLDLRPLPSLTAAQAAVDEQRVYAVLDVQQAPPRLYVSGANGASVVRVLEQLVQAPPRPLPVQVVDLHPLPPTDPQGLTGFYATIAATIVGFVTVFQLRSNASGIPLRPWLVLLAVLAVATGAALALVTDQLLRALPGSFSEVTLILGAQTAITALFNSAMVVLAGRWALLPTWALFIILGNPSSGGAVAAPLLPPFFAAIGRWLPNGATVSALNTAVHLPAHQHPGPFLVLTGWLLATGTLLVVAVRVRGRSPAQ
jgi:hypothetical protein